MKPLNVVYKLVDTYIERVAKPNELGGYEKKRGVYNTRGRTRWRVHKPVYTYDASAAIKNSTGSVAKLMSKRRKVFPDKRVELCSDTAIHWYAHPIQEWLHSEQHTSYLSAVLFEAVPLGAQNVSYDKGGSDGLVLIRRVRRVRDTRRRLMPRLHDALVTLLRLNVLINTAKFLASPSANGLRNQRYALVLKQLRKYRSTFIRHKCKSSDLSIGYGTSDLFWRDGLGDRVNYVNTTGNFIKSEFGRSFAVTFLDVEMVFGEHLFKSDLRGQLDQLSNAVTTMFNVHVTADIFIKAFYQTEKDLDKLGISFK